MSSPSAPTAPTEHAPPITWRGRFPGELLLRGTRSLLEVVEELGASADDLAHASNLGRHLILAKHPELVREVFVGQSRALVKGRGLQRLKMVLGNGLLTSEGEFHLRQRRLVQPAFHRERIARYAETMVRLTDETVRAWRDGEQRDIAGDMHRLTLDIVAKTLFDADLRGRAHDIGRALTAVLDAFSVLLIFIGDSMLRWPLPRMRRARRAIPVLDAAIYAVIEERRRTGEDRGDLLSMLLAARDTESDGSGMSDAQLRDEVMTLFLAGHETTANALAWTWWFVAQHPEVERRLHAELDAVLGGRLPGVEDVPALAYTKAVFSESLRLRPPAYATTRQVVGAYTLGGYAVPMGAQVMVSPWVTHRDPRWWRDPLQFDAERWFRGEPLHKGAYFPFGGGTRICIGEQFAWTEGVLLLATIAQRWRLPLAVAPSHVRARAAVTLRPVPSVPVTVVRRSPLS